MNVSSRASARDPSALLEEWQREATLFREDRKPYLLYE